MVSQKDRLKQLRTRITSGKIIPASETTQNLKDREKTKAALGNDIGGRVAADRLQERRAGQANAQLARVKTKVRNLISAQKPTTLIPPTQPPQPIVQTAPPTTKQNNVVGQIPTTITDLQTGEKKAILQEVTQQDIANLGSNVASIATSGLIASQGVKPVNEVGSVVVEGLAKPISEFISTGLKTALKFKKTSLLLGVAGGSFGSNAIIKQVFKDTRGVGQERGAVGNLMSAAQTSLDLYKINGNEQQLSDDIDAVKQAIKSYEVASKNVGIFDRAFKFVSGGIDFDSEIIQAKRQIRLIEENAILAKQDRFAQDALNKAGLQNGQ